MPQSYTPCQGPTRRPRRHHHRGLRGAASTYRHNGSAAATGAHRGPTGDASLPEPVEKLSPAGWLYPQSIHNLSTVFPQSYPQNRRFIVPIGLGVPIDRTYQPRWCCLPLLHKLVGLQFVCVECASFVCMTPILRSNGLYCVLGPVYRSGGALLRSSCGVL